jgi:hypothetical protein
MSFQAYLDTIRTQTGKTPEDFKKLAAAKGLLGPEVRAGEILAWLKQDFGLGHGHGMAIVAVLRRDASPPRSQADRLGDHFSGPRSRWRAPYDELLRRLKSGGAEVAVAPTGSYVSLLKGKKKFAILATTGERLDVGLKLKGVKPSGRLASAGSWNAMFTHRVQVHDPAQVDAQLLAWLREAYDRA